MFVSPSRPKSMSPDRPAHASAAFRSPTAALLAASPLRNDLTPRSRPLTSVPTSSTPKSAAPRGSSAGRRGTPAGNNNSTSRAGGPKARATSPDVDRYASLSLLGGPAASSPIPLNLPSTTVVDDLLGQLMDLRKELHSVREVNAAQASRIESTALDLRTAQHEVTATRADNVRLDRQARLAVELERQLKDATDQARQATNAWRAEEKERRDMEQAIVELRTAFDRVSRERNAALIDLDAARRVVSHANAAAGEEVRAARRDRDEQAFSVDELRAQLYTIETTHAAQSELTRRKFEAELVAAQGRIDELQEQVVGLEDRNAELEESLTVEKAAREAAEQERDQAKQRYADAELACETARRAVETESAAAVDAASRREAASDSNLARALSKADELSKLCENLMGKLDEREAEVARLEDVNHILAVRLKAAVADSEARSMEAEAREMLTKQNEDMEKQLRELRRVVASLMGKRHAAPGLAASS